MMAESVACQLLLASPSLLDPNFARTVVLIGVHSEEGAMGVVLNRPSTVTIGEAAPLLEEARGTPVTPDHQSPRQAQRPGCRPLPQPGDSAGGWRERSDGGRDPAHGQWEVVLRRHGLGRGRAWGQRRRDQCGPRAALHHRGAAGQTADRRGLWRRPGGRDRTGGELPYRGGLVRGEFWPDRDPARAVAVPGLSGGGGGAGGAADAGTFADGADLPRQGGAGTVAGGGRGGAGRRNRTGGGRIQSDGGRKGDGFRPTGEGARLAGGRHHRPRGAESAVRRAGFPGGDSGLPGEAEAAVALDGGGKDMKNMKKKNAPTNGGMAA